MWGKCEGKKWGFFRVWNWCKEKSICRNSWMEKCEEFYLIFPVCEKMWGIRTFQELMWGKCVEVVRNFPYIFLTLKFHSVCSWVVSSLTKICKTFGKNQVSINCLSVLLCSAGWDRRVVWRWACLARTLSRSIWPPLQAAVAFPSCMLRCCPAARRSWQEGVSLSDSCEMMS